MNPEFLSRLQFGLTISFHFIFPPISMGLGLMMCYMAWKYVRTRDLAWREASFFWVKVYGLVFALGIATGLVQEFEFGTNWSQYSRFVGNVFGSLLAAEGIFAFFLEGGFLGLLLFGGTRLGPKMWFTATALVTFGAHFSAVWILMANSWMQTPQGYSTTHDAVGLAGGDGLVQRGDVHAVVPAPPRARLGGVVDDRLGARAVGVGVVPAEGPAPGLREAELHRGGPVLRGPRRSCRCSCSARRWRSR